MALQNIPRDIGRLTFPVPIKYVDTETCHQAATADVSQHALIVFEYSRLPVGQVYVDPSTNPNLTMGPLCDRLVPPAVLEHARSMTEARVPNPDVSVLICSKDRPEDLKRCLASLSDQSLRPVEIIVVDNGSKGDATRRVAEAEGATYVREDRIGLDFARNTAVRSARTEFVAFADDDVVLHPCWLENLIKAFDKPQIGCVTGLLLPGELATPAQYIFENRWGFGRGYVRKDFGPDFYEANRRHGCPVWEIGAGASQAFRRQIFDEIGLFDTRLDVGAAGCSGDSEYWNRMLHHGYICRYEPTAVSWHFHRPAMESLSRQIHGYMSGHTAALLIQYHNTGNRGNLRRLLAMLPRHYLRKAVKRLYQGTTSDNVFLGSEVAGCLYGVHYVLRRWKAPGCER